MGAKYTEEQLKRVFSKEVVNACHELSFGKKKLEWDSVKEQCDGLLEQKRSLEGYEVVLLGQEEKKTGIQSRETKKAADKAPRIHILERVTKDSYEEQEIRNAKGAHFENYPANSLFLCKNREGVFLFEDTRRNKMVGLPDLYRKKYKKMIRERKAQTIAIAVLFTHFCQTVLRRKYGKEAVKYIAGSRLWDMCGELVLFGISVWIQVWFKIIMEKN